VANRKPASGFLSDTNATAATLVREATGSKRAKGEDLIGSPDLRKAYRDAKKRASKKKR
jgi:hypothetical protein